MSPEQKLFMALVRLQCGLNILWGLTFLSNLAFQKHIWATWLEFLYHRLRALPIWASHAYVQQTMPQPFEETYPNTHVIIDCTLHCIIDWSKC